MIDFVFHLIDFLTLSFETLSIIKAMFAKSINKFCSNNCVDDNGKNGKQILEINNAKNNPKLVAIESLIYFKVFKKVIRPHLIAPSKFVKFLSTTMMSANFFANGVDEFGVIPTSAFLIAKTSLTPSPT
jgi:hypothetical protein